MELLPYLIGIPLLLLGIFLNFYIFVLLKRRAIRKKIKPYLSSFGFEFIDLRDHKFHYKGSFKSDPVSFFMNKNGSNKMSIYKELIFKDSDNNEKRVSVRIDSVLWFVTNVVYKPKIK